MFCADERMGVVVEKRWWESVANVRGQEEKKRTQAGQGGGLY